MPLSSDKLPPLPIIPSDSSIQHWMTQWSYTEVYPSWRIATALAIYGAVLRRNVCFGLGEVGQIWPNLPVLLVGPSGDGKDTIINPSVKLTEKFGIPTVAGRTIEAIKESIFKLAPESGEAAAGVMKAAELSALLGQKDYQQGIVTDLTDILSGGDSVDITLKSTGKRTLEQPTLTMFAGSTRDWLLTMLPEGSLDGGFLPRFIIVPERSKREAGVRPAPNPGRLPKADLERVEAAKFAFEDAVIVAGAEFDLRRQHNAIDPKTNRRRAVSIIEHEDAAAWFENWYESRHKNFPTVLMAFANRSSQLVRKLAMLMAITRGHNWIELRDYEFAIGFIHYIAARLEASVIPVCREVVAGFSIMDMLPAREAELLKELGGKFGPKSVKDGITHLVNTEQIRNEKGMLVKIEKKTLVL